MAEAKEQMNMEDLINEAEKAMDENEMKNEAVEAAEQQAETVSEGLTPEEEIKDLEDRNLRLLAEMQNLRARHQKDLQATREYAVTSFANDMISLSENIYRARDAIPVEEDELYKKLLHGIDLTIEELKKVFAKHGLERVAPQKGDKFDYNFHQAIVQVPTEEVEDGCVLDLINAGYTMKDRVLKPAMVAVAKKPEAPKE